MALAVTAASLALAWSQGWRSAHALQLADFRFAWFTAAAIMTIAFLGSGRLAVSAGHDAMKLHEAMPQAMLLVRGENAGISHNPLESTTSDDMQLGVQAFQALLAQLADEMAKP